MLTQIQQKVIDNLAALTEYKIRLSLEGGDQVAEALVDDFELYGMETKFLFGDEVQELFTFLLENESHLLSKLFIILKLSFLDYLSKEQITQLNDIYQSHYVYRRDEVLPIYMAKMYALIDQSMGMHESLEKANTELQKDFLDFPLSSPCSKLPTEGLKKAIEERFLNASEKLHISPEEGSSQNSKNDNQKKSAHKILNLIAEKIKKDKMENKIVFTADWNHFVSRLVKSISIKKINFEDLFLILDNDLEEKYVLERTILLVLMLENLASAAPEQKLLLDLYTNKYEDVNPNAPLDMFIQQKYFTEDTKAPLSVSKKEISHQDGFSEVIGGVSILGDVYDINNIRLEIITESERTEENEYATWYRCSIYDSVADTRDKEKKTREHDNYRLYFETGTCTKEVALEKLNTFLDVYIKKGAYTDETLPIKLKSSLFMRMPYVGLKWAIESMFRPFKEGEYEELLKEATEYPVDPIQELERIILSQKNELEELRTEKIKTESKKKSKEKAHKKLIKNIIAFIVVVIVIVFGFDTLIRYTLESEKEKYENSPIGISYGDKKGYINVDNANLADLLHDYKEDKGNKI